MSKDVVGLEIVTLSLFHWLQTVSEEANISGANFGACNVNVGSIQGSKTLQIEYIFIIKNE